MLTEAQKARIVGLAARAELRMSHAMKIATDNRSGWEFWRVIRCMDDAAAASAEAFRIAREAPICGSTGATCEHCDDCPEART